jgi:glutamate dehydrogenase/leucine dehydrogenase
MNIGLWKLHKAKLMAKNNDGQTYSNERITQLKNSMRTIHKRLFNKNQTKKLKQSSTAEVLHCRRTMTAEQKKR